MQLGRHKKPILLANVQGFWDLLCALLDHMKALEFIHSRLDFSVLVTDTVGEILPMLRDFAAKVPEEARQMEPTAAGRL
jgi:predicted Rossmann-fold nucleotide-binding protein